MGRSPTWSQEYEKWLKGLLSPKGCEGCPYFQSASRGIKLGIIPRIGAGCVRKPELVIIGLRPGDIHPVEALFYRRALEHEDFRAIKGAWDAMYFPKEDTKKFLSHRGAYVPKMWRLLDEVKRCRKEEPLNFVYITNAVKCQAGGFGKSPTVKRLFRESCKARLQEELNAVKVNFRSTLFLILGSELKNELEEFLVGLKVPESSLFFGYHLAARMKSSQKFGGRSVEKLLEALRERSRPSEA